MNSQFLLRLQLRLGCVALAACVVFGGASSSAQTTPELPVVTFLESDYAYTDATGEACPAGEPKRDNCNWTRVVAVRLISTPNNMPLASSLNISITTVAEGGLDVSAAFGFIPSIIILPAKLSPGAEHPTSITLSEAYRFDEFRIGQGVRLTISASLDYTISGRATTRLFREYDRNQIPFAHINPMPATAATGVTVVLDGSGSYDVDYDASAATNLPGLEVNANGISTFLWSQTSNGPQPTLRGTDGGNARSCSPCSPSGFAVVSFVAPPVPDGMDSVVLEFGLFVNDAMGQNSAGREASVTVTIQRNAVPQVTVTASPPVVAAGAATTVTLTATGTDPDADDSTLTYAWAQTDGNAPLTITGTSSATASVSILESAPVGTVYTFTVTVTDAEGAPTSATVSVTVAAPLQIRFMSTPLHAAEGGAAAEVVVLLGAARTTAFDVTVNVAEAGGATAADYELAHTADGAALDSRAITLRFAAGSTRQTFYVRALADADDEHGADEQLQFSFAAPLPQLVSVGTPGTAVVVLVDATDDGRIPLSRVLIGALDRGAAELVLESIGRRIKTLARGPLAMDEAEAPVQQGRARSRQYAPPAAPALPLAARAAPPAREHDGAGSRRRLHELARQVSMRFSAGGYGVPSPNLWLNVARLEMEGDALPAGEGTAHYDGEVRAAHAGADARFGDGLIGVAVAQSEGELDFRSNAQPAGGAGSATQLSGMAERELRSVHPYLALRPTVDSVLWLVGGYGEGDYEMRESNAQPVSFETDAELWMAAAGFEHVFIPDGGPWNVALRAKGLWARSELESFASSDGRSFEGFRAITRRARIEGEIGRNFVSARGRSWRPYLTASARYDEGDAGEDHAFEAGGGLEARWLDVGASLTLGGRAQVSGAEISENVLFAALRFDPGADELGFHFALRHGTEAAIGGAPWSSTGFGDAEFARAPGDDAAASFEARAAYGWGARMGGGTAGRLTAFATAGANAQREQAGLGLRFDDAALALELGSLWRRGPYDAAPEHRVSLRGRFNF